MIGWFLIGALMLMALCAVGGYTVGVSLNAESTLRYVVNWGSLGDWASAFGSILAASVAIWLAVSDKEKLNIRQAATDDGYWLTVVSVGKKTAVIQDVYLSVRGSTKRIALARPPFVKSGVLPGRYEYGETLVIRADETQYELIAREWKAECAGEDFVNAEVIVATSIGSFQAPLLDKFRLQVASKA